MLRALGKVDHRGFDRADLEAGEQLLAEFTATHGPEDLRDPRSQRVVDRIDPDGTVPQEQVNADRRHPPRSARPATACTPARAAWPARSERRSSTPSSVRPAAPRGQQHRPSTTGAWSAEPDPRPRGASAPTTPSRSRATASCAHRTLPDSGGTCAPCCRHHDRGSTDLREPDGHRRVRATAPVSAPTPGPPAPGGSGRHRPPGAPRPPRRVVPWTSAGPRRLRQPRPRPARWSPATAAASFPGCSAPAGVVRAAPRRRLDRRWSRRPRSTSPSSCPLSTTTTSPARGWTCRMADGLPAWAPPQLARPATSGLSRQRPHRRASPSLLRPRSCPV